jgi:hypothetical protein
MNSGWNNLCSHRLDFSIRKSPDHRLLASPRGLSQLATSFIAFLRLGIHTHALSSLTIKFTLHTLHATQANHPIDYPCRVSISGVAGINLCFIMPVSIQLSKILVPRFAKLRRNHPFHWMLSSGLSVSVFLVGLGRFELPTSPLSGVRSNQLSYRP